MRDKEDISLSGMGILWGSLNSLHIPEAHTRHNMTDITTHLTEIKKKNVWKRLRRHIKNKIMTYLLLTKKIK